MRALSARPGAPLALAWDEAAGFLRRRAQAPEAGPVGRLWLERAALHLEERLDRELRAGQAPRAPEDVAQFLGALRRVGVELGAATLALDDAAEALRRAGGQGYRASQAHQAATRARSFLEGLALPPEAVP